MSYTKSQKMHLENMCSAERCRNSNTCMWIFTEMSGLKNRIHKLNNKRLL